MRNAPKPMAPLTISVRFGSLLADDDKRTAVLKELSLKTRKSADAIVKIAKGEATAKDAVKAAKADADAKAVKAAERQAVKTDAINTLRSVVADGDDDAGELSTDDVIVKAAQIVSSGTVAKSYEDRKRDALRFIVEAMEADDTDTIGAILDVIGETVAADHFMVNA